MPISASFFISYSKKKYLKVLIQINKIDYMRTEIVLLVIILVFAAGYFLGDLLGSKTVYISNYTKPPAITVPRLYFINESYTTFSSIRVPAVDQEGNGVITLLDVQVVPGNGRVLTNIDTLLFWVDTQNSIRTARSVAEEITGMRLSEYDIIYTITANASVIEGASAGAALTIATIAALENNTLNPSVMITGTINHDGTIGPVGEILAKAEVSKSLGATKLLVPLSQSSQITYESKRYCEKVGFSEICTIETIPHKVDVSEQIGIDIIEVRTIEEAMEYLLGD
jgi:uncharacterized protein